MTNLTVQQRDGVFVVDSRLIAPRLGIEHRSFVKTIDRYQEQITSITDKPEDQVLRFEISKPLDNSKGGRPERFVYLTDAQASFVMTLSRNTPQVVECKRQLVAAFEKAKQVIKEVIPAHSAQSTATSSSSLPSAKERLETIHLGIFLFERLGGCDPRTELLLKDHIRNILLEEKLQPALPGRVEWPISDRAVVLGHRPTPAQLQKIGKEAVRLYQERHEQKPVQREQFVGGATRMINVYSEADVDILDQAISLVMGAV